MLKKIFCAALMATILISAKVSAEDVWVCNDGVRDYYVQTESFINRTQYRDNRKFTVDVSLVYGLGAERKNYSFRENDGLIYCNVDGGEDLFVERGTVEEKIWLFGLKYLGIDYEVRYD